MGGRVLYICGGRSFHSSNPGRKIASVVNCWRAMGCEVLHVCGGDILQGADTPNQKEYGGISHHRKWYRRAGVLDPIIRSVSEYRDIQHDQALLHHIKQLCQSFKPHLVWERSSRLHNSGLILAKQIGVPYVLEWKDNIASYWLSLYRNRARRLERVKNQKSDFIVTESEVLRNDLIVDGIDGGKIIVAHNAVDADQFKPDNTLRAQTRRKLAIDDDIVLVGYLGSYAWYHDTYRLIKAMDIVRRNGQEDVRCLMVGSGKEYDKARKMAEKMELLNNKIIMAPGVAKDEVPGILSALDIAVLPGSTDIICPIKIQEYMASELPTLAPDYDCNREVIANDRSGMLFTPGDEQSLAEKISVLATDQELRYRLGINARHEVEHRFTWGKTWGAALERTLDGRS